MMTRPAYFLIALALSLGCATLAFAHSFESHGLVVKHPWARATPPGVPTGAVYFGVTSNGAEDTLTGAATPVAARAMLHRTIEKDGQSTMVHVKRVPVGPGKPISFQPGGYHLMLMQLKQPLEEGERFPLTLHFENAGDIRVQVVVEPVTATGAATGNGAMETMDHE